MGTEGTNTYYDILKISPEDTEREIQQAYRRLAKNLHPDVCHEPDAEELFKTLNEAYSVLSDPHKRTLYDATIRVGEDYQRRIYKNAYQGSEGIWYQDPPPWYNNDRSVCPKKTQKREHQKQPHTKPGKNAIVIPRWGQFILLFLALAMAIIIILQLFFSPLVTRNYQEESLFTGVKGDKIPGEREILPFILDYMTFFQTFPDDDAIWFFKGKTDIMKGDELRTLTTLQDTPRYYRDVAASFLQAYRYSGMNLYQKIIANEFFSPE